MSITIEGLVDAKSEELNVTREFKKFADTVSKTTLFKVRHGSTNHLIMKIGGNTFLDMVTKDVFKVKCGVSTQSNLYNVRNPKLYLAVHGFTVQKAKLILED